MIDIVNIFIMNDLFYLVVPSFESLVFGLLKISPFSVDSKGYHLSSHETRTAIKNAQTDVAQLENNVKEAINEWEKACKSIKENPMIKMEKELWKDFVNNPSKMEKTAETMKSLNKKNDH